MAENSGIEWTDHTFNPWWGCQKVSPGCQHCYAETLANRFADNIWGPPHATDRRLFGDKHWREPVKWNAAAERAGVPARVFCASMADVFEPHPRVVEARARLFELVETTPWLMWLLLTKRPQYVLSMAPASWTDHEWPANAWVGTSVEDQARADVRIPALLEVPAPVRFLSCEPLLGPVTLQRGGMADDWLEGWTVEPDHHPSCDGSCAHNMCPVAVQVQTRTVDWVIVGGESGPGARPMHPRWARDLRDECTAADVPFLFKQWGAWAPSTGRSGEQILMWPDGTRRPDTGPPYTPAGWTNLEHVGKKVAGRELDGRTWDEFPALAVPA